MKTVEKYSKILSGHEEKALGVIYLDDLYKAHVLVDLKTQAFFINDMAYYLNTSYSSFDEINNSVTKDLEMSLEASAISITKAEFYKTLEEHELGKDFILKIKEKFPKEVIKKMLE